MGLRLHRFDATYSAGLLPPALELISTIPDAVKVLYRSFADRYPGIGPDSFRAFNANNLAEVGVGVTLLGGRIEFVLRVDQIVGRATNLTTPEEAQFCQDCAILMAGVTRKLTASIQGEANLRLNSWFLLDGGENDVSAMLKRVAGPTSVPFDGKRVGATTVDYTPRIEVTNTEEGWHLTVAAERSAVAAADLFLLRNYVFKPGGKLGSLEEQLAFVTSSTDVVCEWLGLKPVDR